MPLKICLHKGQKDFQEKVPIALNSVLGFYRKSSSYLKHKGNLVSLKVQTSHFGIGVNAKQAGTYFRNKTAQKLDHIENKPLDAIVTLLTIYQELLLSMIDVVPITPWDPLKMLCMGTVVAEFNNILFKASGKTFEVIQVDFNENIYLADKISEEFKAWIEKTTGRSWIVKVTQ